MFWFLQDRDLLGIRGTMLWVLCQFKHLLELPLSWLLFEIRDINITC